MHINKEKFILDNVSKDLGSNYSLDDAKAYIKKRFDQSDFLAQDEDGNQFLVVKDRGENLAEGGRYHNTTEGGGIHTDSPQYNEQPKILGLYCYKQAMSGGESILVSAQDLYDHLLSIGYASADLEVEFPFEQRPVGNIVFGKIFDVRDGVVYKVRYLRSYIDSAIAKLDGYSFDTKILDAIDKFLDDPSNHEIFRLVSGDLLLVDNYRYLHGRKSFVDDQSEPRQLLRFWLA